MSQRNSQLKGLSISQRADLLVAKMIESSDSLPSVYETHQVLQQSLAKSLSITDQANMLLSKIPDPSMQLSVNNIGTQTAHQSPPLVGLMKEQNFVIQEFEQHHISVPLISDSEEEEDLIPDKIDDGSIFGLDFNNEPSPPPTPERSPSFAPSSIYHSPITGSLEEEAGSDGFDLDSNEPWTLSLCCSR